LRMRLTNCETVLEADRGLGWRFWKSTLFDMGLGQRG